MDTNMLVNESMSFGNLAQQLLALDAGIESVAWEEAGRQAQCARREPGSGHPQPIDPMLFILADGHVQRDETSADPRRLLFVALAYEDAVQIIARLGSGAHVTVAMSPGVDTYALGVRLLKVLAVYNER